MIIKRMICSGVFFAAATLSASAGTSFTIYPNSAVLGTTVSFVNYQRIESKVSQYPNDFFDGSSASLGNGAVYSNILGYPGGKPTIGIFPHMEFGVTTGAGIYKYDRWDDMNRNNLSAPGAGGNAVIHFGTGLTADSDITFKLMFNPGISLSPSKAKHTSSTRIYSYEWSRMDIFSTGAKWRTYLLKGQSDPSWMASFNGITLGVAGDYMHVKVSGRGSYIDNRNISFNITDLGSGSERVSVPIQTSVQGKAAMGWDVVSITPEVMAHANLLYVFGFYTGPSVSLNAGKVYVSSKTSGSMITQGTIYDASGTVPVVAAGSEVASAEMEVSEYIAVPAVVPRWVIGMELNLWKIKVQIEAADVVTNPLNSFTAQLGLRAEF
jgi:hypothetical protein